MALSTKIGSFTRPGGTSDQSQTGFGFAPKVVLFWGNSMTADGATGTGSSGPEYPMYLGMMDSVDAKCYANTDDYSAGGPMLEATSCIYSYSNASGGENAKADFVSLDADGFTIHWYNIDTAVIVNYLALGGSDLTNVKLLDCGTAPTGTGGNVSETGAGFQPDAVIFIAGKGSSSVGGMGMAVSSSQRGSNCSLYDGVAGALRYQRTDKCLSIMEATRSPVIAWEADFVSMDADGFTLNWTTVAAPTAPNVWALCLKGGSYKVGAITEKTSNGTKAETGVGFQPKAVFFSTVGKTSGTSTAAKINQGYGAAVSTSSRAAVDMFDDAQISTRLDRTKCIVHTLDSGGASPTSGGAADLSSMDADGFTLDWTSTDGTARETLYMAFGDTPSAGTKSPPFSNERRSSRRRVLQRR